MHLLNFVAICDLFKQFQVLEEAIRLRLFPFSLMKQLEFGSVH